MRRFKRTRFMYHHHVQPTRVFQDLFDNIESLDVFPCMRPQRESYSQRAEYWNLTLEILKSYWTDHTSKHWPIEKLNIKIKYNITHYKFASSRSDSLPRKPPSTRDKRAKHTRAFHNSSERRTESRAKLNNNPRFNFDIFSLSLLHFLRFAPRGPGA